MSKYDEPVSRVQREILASLFRWGEDKLSDEKHSVTENDFFDATYRDIFIKLNYAENALRTKAV